MCNPLGTARSDETVVAVPVTVAPKPASPKVGLPASTSFKESRSVSVGHNPKRNAFAARAALTSRNSPPPPLPILPTIPIIKNSSLRSFSAPPSPPKMDNFNKSPTEGGRNKPLPMSPASGYGPRTPASHASPASPASAASIKDGMHRPTQRPVLGSPFALRRSSLTSSELPEAVRSLHEKYETDHKRLSKQTEDLHRLEKKVEDYANWIKNELKHQLQQHSDLSGSVNQLSFGVSKEMLEFKNEIGGDVHRLRVDVNRLTTSYNELGEKMDKCIAGLWDNTQEPFIVYQRRKNEALERDLDLLESEISQVKDENRHLTRLMVRVRMGLTLLDPNNTLSYELVTPDALPPASPSGRERVVVTPNAPPATGPVPSGSGNPISPGPSSAQKQTSLPRRAKQSLSKKMSTSQISNNKENSKKQNADLPHGTSSISNIIKSKQDAINKEEPSPDANKPRGGLFGPRRRQGESVSSNTGGKLRSASQKKEGDTVPPVPAIPEGISCFHGNTLTNSRFPPAVIHPLYGEPRSLADIHPALRDEYRYLFPNENTSGVMSSPTVQGDKETSSLASNTKSPRESRPARKDDVRK